VGRLTDNQRESTLDSLLASDKSITNEFSSARYIGTWRRYRNNVLFEKWQTHSFHANDGPYGLICAAGIEKESVTVIDPSNRTTNIGNCVVESAPEVGI
jgi:hypothetical protein